MRRIWIGAGVLLALLAVGVLVMRFTNRQLDGISETLKQASETGDWNTALSLAQKAQKDWEQQWHLMAALSDHSDMSFVDGLFAQLNTYRQYQNEMHHAATCMLLSQVISDLGENHSLNWWNLL